jgi:hypothetical protein
MSTVSPAIALTWSRGRTPITVKLVWLILMVRPITAGSAPQARSHQRWVMTATGAAPARSSSGTIARPSTGWAPYPAK